MGAFFALLGATIGLWLGHGFEIFRFLFLLLGFALGLFWARQKEGVTPFLVGFGVGLLIAAIETLWILPEGKVSLYAMVVRSKENYAIVTTGFHRYYLSLSKNTLEVGDVVHLEGKRSALLMANYESRFDFASYLDELGVKQEIAERSPQVLFSNPFRFRAYQKSFLSHFDADARALLDSLLFGNKDYSSSLIESAGEMNVLFVLSTSGLFYQWILAAFERVIGIFFYKKKELLTLLFASLFLPFGLAKVGLLRVFFMRLLSYLYTFVWKRETPYFNRLGIAGIVILFVDFHYAFSSGFLLGYGISMLLFCLAPLIRHKRKIVMKARSYAILRLFLFPLSMLSGKWHLLGAAFSLLLAPLGFLVLLLGYLSLLTIPFTAVLNPLGVAVRSILEKLQSIDLALPFPPPSVLFLGAFYVLFFLVAFLSELQARYLRRVIILSFLGIYVASLLPIVPLFTQSVSFINVGQGDCCLIQDGFRAVMIDTGGIIGFDMAEESLIPYLRKRRIYKLDAIIASHQDYDHVGAVESLMKHFEVKRYVKDKEDFPLTIGEMTFHNYNTFDAEEENDKSLVLSLDFMDQAWVFTGDAPIWIEKAILKEHGPIDCDVLKVGHHGSDTSTCAEWLDALTPSLAVISCGRKNKFGHPKPSVLALLEQRGIPIRRADLEGTIVLSRFRR